MFERVFAADCRETVIEGLVVTVGKYSERDSLINARAARKFASAAAMFWFEMFTCSSSEFNFASLNASHHLPRITPSFGCANFQSLVSLKASGAISLYAGGVATPGFAYFGALAQLLKSISAISVTAAI